MGSKLLEMRRGVVQIERVLGELEKKVILALEVGEEGEGRGEG